MRNVNKQNLKPAEPGSEESEEALQQFYEDRKGEKGITKDSYEIRFLVKHIASKLRIPQKGTYTVLDIGCDDGYMLSKLHDYNRDLDLYGIDISEKAVMLAKTINKDRHFSFTQGNATCLPFSSRFFDFIICSQIIEHIPKYQDTIDEIERCLKEGGRCFIAFPNYISPSSLYYKSCQKIDQIEGHLNRFRAEEIIACFKYSRLDDLEYDGNLLSLVYFNIIFSKYKTTIMKVIMRDRVHGHNGNRIPVPAGYLQPNTLGKILSFISASRLKFERLIPAGKGDYMALNLIFQKEHNDKVLIETGKRAIVYPR